MNIHKNKFLYGTALALSVSFLSSCATYNINDNDADEKTEATTTENKSSERNYTSSPFSESLEKAREKANNPPEDTPSVLQDHAQPEEP